MSWRVLRVLAALWRGLGSPLRRFGGVLGRLWDGLGASLVRLGPSWGRLGAVFGAFRHQSQEKLHKINDLGFETDPSKS